MVYVDSRVVAGVSTGGKGGPHGVLRTWPMDKIEQVPCGIDCCRCLTNLSSSSPSAPSLSFWWQLMPRTVHDERAGQVPRCILFVKSMQQTCAADVLEGGSIVEVPYGVAKPWAQRMATINLGTCRQNRPVQRTQRQNVPPRSSHPLQGPGGISAEPTSLESSDVASGD